MTLSKLIVSGPRGEARTMTVYHAEFRCSSEECAGIVRVNGETQEAVASVTVTGVPCSECDQTYTVEITAKEAR